MTITLPKNASNGGGDCQTILHPGKEAIMAQGKFRQFYTEVFVPEHRHPGTAAFHMAGTLSGLALVAAALTVISPWWLFAFPVAHVGPGLVGHRLFERNETAGDLRVTRSDYPRLWFLAANHVMTARLLLGRRA